jgi:hypothetical protein
MSIETWRDRTPECEMRQILRTFHLSIPGTIILDLVGESRQQLHGQNPEPSLVAAAYQRTSKVRAIIGINITGWKQTTKSPSA